VSAPAPAIQTLIVEDEKIAGEAHAAYLAKIAGFVVVGNARSGREALVLLAERRVDLVLLDLNLPDGHGLELVRAMRAAGHAADVLAVTAARDLEVVRRAVNLGVVQYLLKPFSFAMFKDKLEQYAAYRQQAAAGGRATDQVDVDRLFRALRGRGAPALPKGMTAETLAAVASLLSDVGPDRTMSANEAAAALGLSRVTARRYLEHLAEYGAALRAPRYGGPGRPEVGYRPTHDS